MESGNQWLFVKTVGRNMAWIGGMGYVQTLGMGLQPHLTFGYVNEIHDVMGSSLITCRRRYLLPKSSRFAE